MDKASMYLNKYSGKNSSSYKPAPQTIDDISLDSDADENDIMAQLSDSDSDAELRDTPSLSSAQKLFGGNNKKAGDGGSGGLGAGLKRNTALKPNQMLAKSGQAGQTARNKEAEKEKERMKLQREREEAEALERDLSISSAEPEEAVPRLRSEALGGVRSFADFNLDHIQIPDAAAADPGAKVAEQDDVMDSELDESTMNYSTDLPQELVPPASPTYSEMLRTKSAAGDKGDDGELRFQPFHTCRSSVSVRPTFYYLFSVFES
jgi:hypothetical protein